MRINDRELIQLCNETPIFEGRLNYRPPGGNFGQSTYKERWFRLRCNMLFYFRISDTGKVESEPSGLFVLENTIIQLEQSSSMPFVFSIIFKDEPYKKHLFSGRSDANIQAWVNSLKQCSYEYLRSQRILLQKKITLKTGKDPLLMYPYNEGAIRDFETVDPVKGEGSPLPIRTAPPVPSYHHHRKQPQQTTFQSHLAPVPPPRSSSPKTVARAPPPIPPQSVGTVKTPSVTPLGGNESARTTKPVLSQPMQPLRAPPPPLSSTPQAPLRPAPSVPSKEVNLIDL
ncbi:pleckstrin homology domain-containing family J member 1-like [Ischnura elegans]|uniref:pleckstrin homology domain-containing family J member 1-like n=1 Tax=Ischnura elegans TaxID=197161 RepID=UPI001ED86890|nr:pleckstrin homology domain-containing family J member 1-like [Ischnura elegans]